MMSGDVISFIMALFQWLGSYISQAVMDPVKATVVGVLFIFSGYLGRALTAIGIVIIAVSLFLYATHILVY